MQKNIKVVDLFAGIGGIRKGFERAFSDGPIKLRTVMAAEIDRAAQRSYKANNSTDNLRFESDVTAVKVDYDLPAFDICLAGFPCQAFSLAGLRLGFDDPTKGTLFFDVKRLCTAKLPKIIFCENVKGLVSHKRGETFRVIRESFSEMGYELYYKVLNSKDYGVPQNRERIYLVGIRKDLVDIQREKNLKAFDFPSPTGPRVVLDDILETDVPYRYYLSQMYLDTLKRHKARHTAKGNGFGYVVRKRDDIAGALVCGGMGRERNLICENLETFELAFQRDGNTYVGHPKNDEGIRIMTPREWALLQGYTDFVYEDENGRISDSALYKQFGNTVTVNVIQSIAVEIRKYLEQFLGFDEAVNAPVKSEEQLRWIYERKLYNCPIRKTKYFFKREPSIGDKFYIKLSQLIAPSDEKTHKWSHKIFHGLCMATYVGRRSAERLKVLDKYSVVALEPCTVPKNKEYDMFELEFLSDPTLSSAIAQF